MGVRFGLSIILAEVLRERHRVRADEADDFNIRDMTEITNTLSATTALMANLLLTVALISLVVGGVGILLGHGGSKLVEWLHHWPVENSPAAIALPPSIRIHGSEG